MPETRTEQNKASGKPPGAFVQIDSDGYEVWWTPAQTRQFAAFLLESGDPANEAFAHGLLDAADAIDR